MPHRAPGRLASVERPRVPGRPAAIATRRGDARQRVRAADRALGARVAIGAGRRRSRIGAGGRRGGRVAPRRQRVTRRAGAVGCRGRRRVERRRGPRVAAHAAVDPVSHRRVIIAATGADRRRGDSEHRDYETNASSLLRDVHRHPPSERDTHVASDGPRGAALFFRAIHVLRREMGTTSTRRLSRAPLLARAFFALTSVRARITSTVS